MLLALVMSLVQGFGGIIGVVAHDPAKTYGTFVLPSRTSLGLCGYRAHRKGWREKVFCGRDLFAAKSKVTSEHAYGDHEPCAELVNATLSLRPPAPSVRKFPVLEVSRSYGRTAKQSEDRHDTENCTSR